MGKLEEDVKDFLGDVEDLFGTIVSNPGEFLDPRFAKDPEFIKTLQGAFAEVQPAFEDVKQKIDALETPLEVLDPILPLKMAVYKKLTGKED